MVDHKELTELLDDLIDYLSGRQDDSDHENELYWRCRAIQRELRRYERYVNRAV